MEIGVSSVPNSSLTQAWTRDGYAQVCGLLSPARLAAVSAELDRLVARRELLLAPVPGVPFRQDLSGAVAPDRIDPVTPHSALLAELSCSREMLDPVEFLLGEPAVLFKDKVHFKPPGTMGYGLHQDVPGWLFTGVPADRFVTVFLAVDECTVENGTVEFHAGQHKALLPAPPGQPVDIDESRVSLVPSQPVELRAGDAVLIHPLVPHRSGPNTTNTRRRSLLFTYSARQYGDQWACYYKGRAQALRNS